MKLNVRDLIVLVVLLLGFGHALYVYADLPELIPVHFDIQGNPDLYASLPNGAFMGLVIAIALAIIMRLIMAHPSATEIRGYLHNVLVVLVLMITALNVVVLEFAKGTEIVPARFAWLVTGVLLVVISNPMGKLPINAYAGVRIPSTMDDPEVWQRTNRFAGWVGVLIGLGMVVAYFAPIELPVVALLVCVLIFALAVAIYARRLSKQLKPGSSS